MPWQRLIPNIVMGVWLMRESEQVFLKKETKNKPGEGRNEEVMFYISTSLTVVCINHPGTCRLRFRWSRTVSENLEPLQNVKGCRWLLVQGPEFES